MENQLFRKKSLDRVSSPEQLNDYIRVANPGVWIVLCAVILFLVGVIVWGIFGRLETTLTVGAITQNGQTVCFVKESDLPDVTRDMTVKADDKEYQIARVAVQPIQVDSSFPDYLAHVGDLSQGEWVYAVFLDASHGESGGIYQVQIVVESIAPMTFVTN